MTPRVMISYLRKSIILKGSGTHLQPDFGFVKNPMTHTGLHKLLCPSHDELSPKHSPHCGIIHQLLQAARSRLARTSCWKKLFPARKLPILRHSGGSPSPERQAGDGDHLPRQGNNFFARSHFLGGLPMCRALLLASY